jgi:hypothetical protein
VSHEVKCLAVRQRLRSVPHSAIRRSAKNGPIPWICVRSVPASWYIAERTSKLGSLGSLLRCLAFGSGASGTGLSIFNPATARSISASHSSMHR